ncbi:MAG: hypothetical protein JW775_05560 [Candidatus Aminicenantes bacterium]|nr:hypothetical protein [Candidatus Aminicenantes bacterium]
MKKRYSPSALATLILGLVTFLWLLFHVYEVRTDLAGVIRFDASEPSHYLIGAGYLVMLAFHAAAFIFVFSRARLAKRLGGWPVLGLASGVVSLAAIAAEKVLYDEIGREMTIEFPVPGEVSLLYAALGLNLLFAAAMMVAAFRGLAREGAADGVGGAKDERVFALAQAMGVVSGAMGLGLTGLIIARGWPAGRLWVFIPFYALFLVPYGLAVLYWLGLKRRDRSSEWYDEKQVRDMLKASLATLALSVPGLAILGMIPRPIGFAWFPYYLFLVLTLFSAGTLYFFRQD